MSPIQLVLVAVYYGALGGLVLFAMHRLALAVGLLRRAAVPHRSTGFRSSVCVQLPLYNEPAVAARLIASAGAMRWPRELLEVQVLDDSTDETREVVDRSVAELRARGVAATVLRRPSRGGFKAGALQYGLTHTDAELVAIFDADFVPPAHFLEALAGEFADPKVALVQSRWEHLNPERSLLTRAQAALLDGHFAVEQPARAAVGAFFNFNGTAGIWRRSAIDDAGGWQGDTLTEDLDLSYRAQLRGWRFVYRPDVTAPAEIPEDIGGFRSQQHRWAKGSIECLVKLLPSVLRADVSRREKFEALVHLSANCTYPLLVTVAVLMPVIVLLRTARPVGWLGGVDLILFSLGSFSVVFFYLLAARRAQRRVGRALFQLPLVIAVDIGISLQKARAVLEALAGQRSEFVRTPKSGSDGKTKKLPPSYGVRRARPGSRSSRCRAGRRGPASGCFDRRVRRCSRCPFLCCSPSDTVTWACSRLASR
jgi:cellulose synthase/poly-beta-1,6-N-acetylglucosamine synthase-like glycosyltransferase